MKITSHMVAKPALTLAIAIMVSCAPQTKKTGLPPEPIQEEMPAEIQEELSMASFELLLSRTQDLSMKERRPILEKGYYQMIEKFPDSFLSEESHMRLILLYMEQFNPPQVEKAEQIYRDYYQNYPQPRLGRAINETMARSYYNVGEWRRLEEFCVPFVKRYLESKDVNNSLYMYYYSEAKFNQGELLEAERGFRMLSRDFGDSGLGGTARMRLEDIAIKKQEQESSQDK